MSLKNLNVLVEKGYVPKKEVDKLEFCETCMCLGKVSQTKLSCCGAYYKRNPKVHTFRFMGSSINSRKSIGK